MKKINICQKKKIALVLSGGGIKAAAFHIGVCLALKEKGFLVEGGTKEQVAMRKNSHSHQIKLLVGSSAGAFISAVLASGCPVESLITAFQVGIGDQPFYKHLDLNKVKPIGYRHVFHLNGKRILSFIPETLLQKSILSDLASGGIEVLLKQGFKLNGFFNTHGIEKYLRKNLLAENDFNRLGIELYIISTQLNHSRKVIFGPYNENFETDSILHIGNTPISDAVAASTSLPPVFAPYRITYDQKNLYLYDGEIRDTMSTHVAEDHGADLVIASYSMQPYQFSEEMGSLHKYGIPAIVNQALYQVLEQKVAKHILYQNQKKSLYAALQEICNLEGVSSSLTQKILSSVESQLHFNHKVDHIYIAPKQHNSEMFFADHFSLNPKILEKIVWMGFKSALHNLKFD